MRQIASEVTNANGILFADVLERSPSTLYAASTCSPTFSLGRASEREEIAGLVFPKLSYPSLSNSNSMVIQGERTTLADED